MSKNIDYMYFYFNLEIHRNNLLKSNKILDREQLSFKIDKNTTEKLSVFLLECEKIIIINNEDSEKFAEFLCSNNMIFYHFKNIDLNDNSQMNYKDYAKNHIMAYAHISTQKKEPNIKKIKYEKIKEEKNTTTTTITIKNKSDYFKYKNKLNYSNHFNFLNLINGNYFTNSVHKNILTSLKNYPNVTKSRVYNFDADLFSGKINFTGDKIYFFMDNNKHTLSVENSDIITSSLIIDFFDEVEKINYKIEMYLTKIISPFEHKETKMFLSFENYFNKNTLSM